MASRTTGRGWGSRWTRGLAAVGVLGIALTGALVPLAGPASAAEDAVWIVEPTGNSNATTSARRYFIYDVGPEQVVQDAVDVTNKSPGPLPLVLYAADAYNAGGGGGFAFSQVDETPDAVGSWIQFAATSSVRQDLTVNPGETVTVPFTLRVPPGTAPGDYAGGIVGFDPTPSPTPADGGAIIQVTRAVGARVYARVAGPLKPELSIVDLAVSPAYGSTISFTAPESVRVTFTVANEGNTRITPNAQISFSGLFGRDLGSLNDVAVPEVLPGQKVDIEATWDSPPPLDRLVTTVTLTGEGIEEEADAVTWLIPLGWLLAALAAAIAMTALRIRRAKASATSDEALETSPIRKRHAQARK